MSPYILLYKTLVPWKYRQYLQLAGGNRDKCHETLQHGTFYEEYDAYDFAEKNEAERRSYLTDALRDKICRKVNSHHGEKIMQTNTPPILGSKTSTTERYGLYKTNPH